MQESGGPPTVWMYWEDAPGRRRPAYLDICLETVQKHAPDGRLRVLGPLDALEVLPETDPSVWARLPDAARRADYLRTRVVHRYGGLWLDFDCMVMRPLQPLIDLLEDHPLVGWGRELTGRFYNNLFAARPGTDFLARWIELQDEVLARTSDWERLEWAALGMSAATRAGRPPYLNLPLQQVAPILWSDWRKILSPFASPRPIVDRRPHTVMLWNKAMHETMAAIPRSELVSSKMLLSRLFRMSLGLSTLEEELDWRTRFSPLAQVHYGRIAKRMSRSARSATPSRAGRARKDAGSAPGTGAQAGARAIATPRAGSRARS